MGNRKKESAQARKDAQQSLYFASLTNIASSPRKMRLVIDMVRGMEVNRALAVLRYSNKRASEAVGRTLKSAVANWEQKNEQHADEGQLYISKIYVDEAPTLKRMRARARGRGNRVRKRRSNLTIYVDARDNAINE
ncbi:MAG: 50S ribosomal protein L22 [Porphyromonas sp.]|uniref:50S ribosomal protein L22 n=1 Tax=Porphyromonas sp. TaxID=1924944 RepID=UPI002A91257F|nr:50S ribosomal protein L22 [Porphyromonas sp.]MDD7468891.1 50S ribosomal protein L22 [Bacteroidales bacterium]MDY6102336.1 50S ribosomal protein L22 [Porphyromonas sp.]